MPYSGGGEAAGAASSLYPETVATMVETTDPAFRLEQFCRLLGIRARPLGARPWLRTSVICGGWPSSWLATGSGAPRWPRHSDLRAYVFHLKDRGLAASSIRRVQSSLRTYWAFLLGDGVVEVDPTERLESPRVGRLLPVVLSRDDVARLLESPDPDHPLHCGGTAPCWSSFTPPGCACLS